MMKDDFRLKQMPVDREGAITPPLICQYKWLLLALSLVLLGTVSISQAIAQDEDSTATPESVEVTAEVTAEIGPTATPDPNATPTEAPPVVYTVLVDVESAFIRALPDFDAEPIASVFRNEILEVVSRNLTGDWFEVRRPRRMNSLGWIFENVVEWDFPPEFVPLGDFTTGLEGPNPITVRPEFGVFIEEGVALRNTPNRDGDLIINVPPRVTIPVIARNQDGSWLQVNYIGYQGWIINFTTRELADVLAIPEAPNLPPLEVSGIPIIPVEVQLEELERLRGFIFERLDLAIALESFWWDVFRGEVLPCDPPAAVTEYAFTLQDVRELPELQRELPRLDQAIGYMNEAINILDDCGVIRPEDVIRARNNSINARVIFDAALERLEILEELIE